MNTCGHIQPDSAPSKEATAPLKPHHIHSGLLIELSNPIPYQEAWTLQQRLHAERLAGTRPDVLLLLEHQPVYTMGRRTASAHLGLGETALRRMGATVQAVNRGGSITYHGPGQLVGYPILQLSRYAQGPKAYVRLLEDVLIGTLALWGVEGHRVDKNPGVWVRSDQGDAKIASIGIRIDRGITLHGFALNVDLDLAPFSRIMPCGLAECRATSLAELCHTPVSVALVAEQIAEIFSDLFRISWTYLSAGGIDRELVDRSLTCLDMKEA
ncbi:lipoyl(octanoyl) transferase LipB [Petrachloros mirabilis]